MSKSDCLIDIALCVCHLQINIQTLFLEPTAKDAGEFYSFYRCTSFQERGSGPDCIFLNA